MNIPLLPKGMPIYVTAAIFVGVLATVVLVVIALGKVYQGGISRLSGESAPNEYGIRKKKQIRKITLQKGDESGCFEIMPDGVVRVYAECGGELTDAARYQDPKRILQLFELASAYDLTKYRNSGPGQIYTLTIESDEGTEIITIVINDQNSDEINQVIDTIDTILEDFPDPTPLPAGASPQPSVSIVPGQSPVPSPSTVGSTPQPSGSGTGGVELTPFSCGFTENFASGKPYRVSNIVCTEEPQASGQ